MRLGFRAMARMVLVERLNFPAEYVEQQLAHTVPLGIPPEMTTVGSRGSEETKSLPPRGLCAWECQPS